MAHNIRVFGKKGDVKIDKNEVFTIKNGAKIVKKSFPKRRSFSYKINEFAESAV